MHLDLNTIIFAGFGSLWTVALFLAKFEISRMNTAIEKLSESLRVLSMDFYKLQGEHTERCKIALV